MLLMQNIFSIMLVCTSKVQTKSSKDTLCQNQHCYNRMSQFFEVFKSHFLVYLKDVNDFLGNILIYF